MPRGLAKKPRPDAVHIGLHLDPEESALMRQFCAIEGIDNTSHAARIILMSVLRGDRKWWAVVRHQRQMMMNAFKQSMYASFMSKLDEMRRDVQDEMALFDMEDPARGHAD